MDHVAGHDFIKAAVREGKCGDISLRESDIMKGSTILFCLLQHVSGEISRCKKPAIPRDHSAEKTCSAGTFQNNIVRFDQIRHDFFKFLMCFPVNDVNKDVVYAGHLIPEHPAASFFCVKMVREL